MNLSSYKSVNSYNWCRMFTFKEKIQLTGTKFEFAGGVAYWCVLGHELSTVNIATCCTMLQLHA